MNTHTERKKGGNLCVIRNPPSSSRRRFVELSCVSTLTENPNQIVRGEGLETQVDFASSNISTQERTCPVFSCLLGFVVSLSYTFSSIQSLFSVIHLHPEVLWGAVAARICTPASPLWGSDIHWQPKQQISLRVFIARLIPRQQVVVPVSVHSASWSGVGVSQWEKSPDRQGITERETGEVRGN